MDAELLGNGNVRRVCICCAVMARYLCYCFQYWL